MAHCPPGYTHDNFGNCVYSPVDYTQDPTFTGAGTGDVFNPQEGSELWQIKEFLEDKGVDWGDYATSFETYGESPWWEKEEMLREFAGIDIDQLYTTWGLTSGQLLGDYTGYTGDLYEDWYGTEGFIGEEARLQNLITGAGTMWDLLGGGYDPATGLGGDIGRREWEYGVGWSWTQNELARLRGEYGAGWTMKKGGFEDEWASTKEQIGLGTRGALLQAGYAQDVALSSIGFATAGTSAFDRMQREIREGYTRGIEEGERKLGYDISLGEFSLGQAYAGLGWDPETGEWGGGQYEQKLNTYNAVMGGLAYERSIGQQKYDDEIDRLNYLLDSGQLTYDQALDEATRKYNDAVAAGELATGMSITDIGQGLESNIWGTQQDWRDEQISMLHSLIGGGIFGLPDGNGGGCIDPTAINYNPEATTDDGSCDYLTTTESEEILEEITLDPECVLPGTKIETKRGEINIEDTKEDDLIRVYNFKTKEFGWSSIDAITTATVKGWSELVTEKGYTLKCSNSHLMYNPDYPNSAIAVDELGEGGELYVVNKANGKIESDKVVSIELHDEEVEVWNYELDITHNYLSNCILSHNRITKEDIVTDPLTNEVCYYDTTGMLQCISEWDLGPTGLWDDPEDDVPWWQEWYEGDTFDEGMQSMCQQEVGANTYWDPIAGDCITGAGEFEGGQDENVFIDPNDCPPGMVPTGGGACAGFGTPGPDGFGGGFKCVGPCAIFLTALDAVGVDPGEWWDSMKDEYSMEGFLSSVEDFADDPFYLQSALDCWFNDNCYGGRVDITTEEDFLPGGEAEDFGVDPCILSPQCCPDGVYDSILCGPPEASTGCADIVCASNQYVAEQADGSCECVDLYPNPF